MTIKATLAVLLTLCGAGLVSSVQAADFRCLVYSGANGTTLEKTTNKDGAYDVAAADIESAKAAALKKGAQYKKGVTLTRAECTPAAAGSGAATTATPAPATGGTRFYCMIYDADNQDIAPPAGKGEMGRVWWVPAPAIKDAEGAAVALATSEGFKADSAMCGSSIENLMNNY